MLSSMFSVRRAPVPPPPTPRQPAEPPIGACKRPAPAGSSSDDREAKRRETERHLAGRQAERADKFAEGIVISVELTPHSGDDDDTMDKIAMLGGRWRLTGKNGGSPVYRQDAHM